MQEQRNQSYPANTGPLAHLSEEAKKKRLDATVRLWLRYTEKRIGQAIERDGYLPFLQATGLDEYRYSVWLRFPEWERSAVLGQVITLGRSTCGAPQDPAIFTSWHHDPLLKTLPDWQQELPDEDVFTLSVRITPGSLGEDTKWAIMPWNPIRRNRPFGWPTQQEWMGWTRSFDWQAVAVGFVRAMLDA